MKDDDNTTVLQPTLTCKETFSRKKDKLDIEDTKGNNLLPSTDAKLGFGRLQETLSNFDNEFDEILSTVEFTMELLKQDDYVNSKDLRGKKMDTQLTTVDSDDYDDNLTAVATINPNKTDEMPFLCRPLGAAIHGDKMDSNSDSIKSYDDTTNNSNTTSIHYSEERKTYIVNKTYEFNLEDEYNRLINAINKADKVTKNAKELEGQANILIQQYKEKEQRDNEEKKEAEYRKDIRDKQIEIEENKKKYKIKEDEHNRMVLNLKNVLIMSRNVFDDSKMKPEVYNKTCVFNYMDYNMLVKDLFKGLIYDALEDILLSKNVNLIIDNDDVSVNGTLIINTIQPNGHVLGYTLGVGELAFSNICFVINSERKVLLAYRGLKNDYGDKSFLPCMIMVEEFIKNMTAVCKQFKLDPMDLLIEFTDRDFKHVFDELHAKYNRKYMIVIGPNNAYISSMYFGFGRTNVSIEVNRNDNGNFSLIVIDGMPVTRCAKVSGAIISPKCEKNSLSFIDTSGQKLGRIFGADVPSILDVPKPFKKHEIKSKIKQHKEIRLTRFITTLNRHFCDKICITEKGKSRSL